MPSRSEEDGVPSSRLLYAADAARRLAVTAPRWAFEYNVLKDATLGVGVSVEARRGHPTHVGVLCRRGGHADSVVNHAINREVRHHGPHKVFLGERLLVGLRHEPFVAYLCSQLAIGHE